MNWVKTIAEQELAEGGKQVVKVGERAILLVRQKGQVYAMNSTCPHMGGPLHKGTLTEDGAIVCPWHHSAFDIRSGDVKAWAPWPPGVGKVLGAISREKVLRVYPTRVEEGYVWIGLEEKA